MALVCLTACGFAQTSQPIPVDKAVRIGKLDNGVTYYIRHNAEPKGQANFYIAKPENPSERYYVPIPDNDKALVCMAKDKEQPYAMSSCTFVTTHTLWR